MVVSLKAVVCFGVKVELRVQDWEPVQELQQRWQ